MRAVRPEMAAPTPSTRRRPSRRCGAIPHRTTIGKPVARACRLLEISPPGYPVESSARERVQAALVAGLESSRAIAAIRLRASAWQLRTAGSGNLIRLQSYLEQSYLSFRRSPPSFTFQRFLQVTSFGRRQTIAGQFDITMVSDPVPNTTALPDGRYSRLCKKRTGLIRRLAENPVSRRSASSLPSSGILRPVSTCPPGPLSSFDCRPLGRPRGGFPKEW
jgi:hypothetical protein